MNFHGARGLVPYQRFLQRALHLSCPTWLTTAQASSLIIKDVWKVSFPMVDIPFWFCSFLILMDLGVIMVWCGPHLGVQKCTLQF